MAEYLAPGVYIEETSFRSKSIEGVSTSTTAFVGPTSRGPVGGTPELLTSGADFERMFGGASDLDLGAGVDGRNYLALAVQAFFENGGGRLYVSRAFEEGTGDGKASAVLATGTVVATARFPGAAGNGTVTFRESRSTVSGNGLDKLPVGSVVEATLTGTLTLCLLTSSGWQTAAGATATFTSADLLTVTFTGADANGNVQQVEGLSYGSAHPRYVGTALPAAPGRRADALSALYSLSVGDAITLTALRTALVGATGDLTVSATGGDDGAEPSTAAYKAALAELEKLDDISIIAAPGHTEYTDAAGIRQAVLTHVETRGLYRVAVLDSKKGDNNGAIRDTRGSIDSDAAALYFPWVTISNPNAKTGDTTQPREIDVPPSGFVAGIYARNDVERGVWKSPANEVVRGAIRFEQDITLGENEMLNPLGVNCLRYFPGRGYRVWGARTASSDPEWKYLSVRRYFNYMKGSIERGTQWAVFEPNGPALWSNVRETIDSFLYNEYRQGALLGDSAKEAYFVRCDRTTMTQNDLDNGRMVCLIGVAVVKPAEFVIFRIGQKTASARE